jgi:hypothetical protein
MRQTHIPVLTWHGYNVFGNDYHRNDLIAFRDDLSLIAESGFAIVPLANVARWVRGEYSFSSINKPVLAISCDDGTDYDWRDTIHPEHGRQTALASTLRSFRTRYPSQVDAELTSFVIASPSARAQICRGAMNQQNALNDDWWQSAVASQLLAIESHGWDHNHPAVSPVIQPEQHTGDFFSINSFSACDAHVRASAHFIESRAQRRPILFAYPWMQASDYMRFEYMPKFAEAHGFIAAFGGQSDYVTQQSDRWYLPRYVFGSDWRNQDGLRAILQRAIAA